jgi:DtxR family Mn-dependent transcriptional regulator
MSADASEAQTTTTVDRYLETIYCIAGEGEVVRPSRLAQWLGVSAPTVSNALQRLARDGWIDVAGDRSVALTDAGGAKASAIVRRHRVLERWLADVLAFDWAEADAEADRLSSAVSDAVIDRIDASMGRPLTCPHGNAIPGRTPRYGELVSLADLEPGTPAHVRRISEVAEHEARTLLRSLQDAGIREGSHVVVSAEIADPTVLSVDVSGRTLTIATTAARWIWVEPGTGSSRAPTAAL